MNSHRVNRTPVTDAEVEIAVMALRSQLKVQLKRWGPGTFSSRHEILGAIEEELAEVKEAVRTDGSTGCIHVAEELLDLAVGAVFGYACIKAEKTDW